MKHRLISFGYKVVGISLCVYYWNEPYFWGIMSAYFGVYAFYLVLASAKIQLNLHIKSINNFHRPGVLLTFDDGPNPLTSPAILSILDKHNVKAIFFVIGKQAELYPEMIKEIHDKGHTLGNHSYSHHNLLPFFFRKSITRDFDKCSDVIKEIIGKKPLLIRPPFGVTSPRYYSMLQKTNYTSMGWSIRSLDTIARDSAILLSQLLQKIRKTKGEILLLHDTLEVTVAMLPNLITQLRERGTNIVSPEEILEKPVYE